MEPLGDDSAAPPRLVHQRLDPSLTARRHQLVSQPEHLWSDDVAAPVPFRGLARREEVVEEGEARFPRAGVAQLLYDPLSQGAKDLVDRDHHVVEVSHRPEEGGRSGIGELDLHAVLVATKLGKAGAGLVADHERAE